MRFPFLHSRIPVLVLLAVACTRGAPLLIDAPGPTPSGMVWIPGGRFEMGSESPLAGPEEGPVHVAEVDGFYIDVHTVTNARFRQFVDATGYLTIAERKPELAELMRQLPAGAAPPSPELLVPGSVVFTPTRGPVDLRDW